MKILGIDPGLATTGFGILSIDSGRCQVVGSGVITTKPGNSLDQRLGYLYRDLVGIVRQHNPDHMAVEALFFNTNTTTALNVAHARGVMLLCGSHHRTPVSSYTPLQVKTAVCGFGRASKQQVQGMVKRLLHLAVIPRPDDAADALAVALCHHHVFPLKSRL